MRVFSQMTDWNLLALRWGNRVERALGLDRELRSLAKTFEGDCVLEIGGPTELFGARHRLPLYLHVAELDATNYAEQTVWTSDAEWQSVRPRNSLICEATRLTGIEDGTYDAVLASHVIEHLADPLSALQEWARVTMDEGRILIVAPHIEGTFDHHRPVTTMGHMRNDAARGTAEDDLTHLPEVLSLHDLARDPGSTDMPALEMRGRRNFVHRALHHHVFDTRRLMETVEEVGLSVYFVACRRPHHIVLIAGRRESLSMSPESRRRVLAESPFHHDRRAAII